MGACSSIKKRKNKKEKNKPTVVISKTQNQNTNNNNNQIVQAPVEEIKNKEENEIPNNQINNDNIVPKMTSNVSNSSNNINDDNNNNASSSETKRTNIILYDNPNNNDINFNVSINDEFPSNTNRNIDPNPNISFPVQLPYNSNRINEERIPQDINMQNAQDSLRQIIRLVRNFNPRLYNNNMLTLLGLSEEIESKEYLNWFFNPSNKTWFNKGKIVLSDDELNKIEQLTDKEVYNKNYYVKRIWFAKYINKNIYDNRNDNSPLVVSRENILEESFNQFMTSQDLNLRANMHIYFVDEIAYDVGGVYREWYSCLFKEIFSKENNFFMENVNKSEDKGSFLIPMTEPTFYKSEYLLYYEFIGKVIGKALFDKIMIGQNFNRIILKHLMNYKIEQFDIEDIKYYDISIYNSLKEILKNDMDSNSDLYFVWEISNIEYELIPNGKEILIKNTNKFQFVKKVVEFICYNSISKKIDKLKEGFDFIMSNKSSILQIFTIDEFNFLLSGQSKIDLTNWKENTFYKGYYTKDDPTIKMFWDVLNELTHEELLAFYKFCTGCSRVPIDGFGSLQGTRNKQMKFCIESPPMMDKDENRLIEAHTCFNRICLPEYGTKEKMKKAIYTIINNDTNFFGLK